MKRLFGAFGIATVLTLIAAGVASAHHIVNIEADCKQGTIVISGKDFSRSNFPVELDGPGEYDEVFTHYSKNWTHAFPLGGNGSYIVFWNHSNGNEVRFDVSCEQPTPTPTPEPTPTPTPVVTPSPTPCADCVPTTFTPSFPPDQSTPPSTPSHPSRTAPPSDTVSAPQAAGISWMSFIAGYMAGIASIIAVALFARRRNSR